MEVDSVTAGEGRCHVGLAWFCLLQPDCLTPVKAALFHRPSLNASFRQGVRRFSTPCMLCKTAVVFVLRLPAVQRGPPASLVFCASDLLLYLGSVLQWLLAARKLHSVVLPRHTLVSDSKPGLSGAMNA